MSQPTQRGQVQSQGVRYPTAELVPQGTQMSTSPRGAALLIAFTNPQRPLYGHGLTSCTLAPSGEYWPGQGPIDRGY